MKKTFLLMILLSLPWRLAGSDDGNNAHKVDVPAGVEQELAELVTEETEGETLNLKEVSIGENSSLVIPAFKSIYIQKLVVGDGGRIRLAHQGSGGESSAKSRGGNGANARIFLEELNGHLLIEARGGDGGNGNNGRDGRQGKDGKDGRRARTLFFGIVYLGDGENGRMGERGENGEAGGDGGDGGTGGVIAVYFRDRSAFANVVVDVDGGDGGKSGKPGVGGLGGNGGKGGRGIKSGNPGLMGRTGKAGSPGMPGRPGNPGKAFVYQVESKLFSCLSRLETISTKEELRDDDYAQCRIKDSSVTNMESAQLFAPSPNEILVTEEKNGAVYLNADGKEGKTAANARGFWGATSRWIFGIFGWKTYLGSS